MKALILAALSAVLLTGCPATVKPTDQNPQTAISVGMQVPVVVREKCVVEMPPEPNWQVGVVPAANTTEFEKSKAVLAELEQRRDYESQIKAAVKKCE